ncbi:MAG: SEL1-like repeat protein, partial [Ruthenibacterium sp.]
GWWTQQGAENIKSELARTIFRQELVSIFEEQTQYRDLLTAESKAAMHELCRKASGGICDNEKVMELLPALGERLKNIGGKKVYGYLQPDVKQMVDAIVNELAKDENLAKLYDAWYEKRFDILRTYTDTMPPKEPLSQLKEFKAIKNMVIKEAVQLASGGFSFEDERMVEPQIVEDAQPPEYDPALPDVETIEFEDADEPPHSASDEPLYDGGEVYVAWTAQYKQAKIYLFGNDETPPDFVKAFELLTLEAENGNALAMHDIGRMFADGLGQEIDFTVAYQWYAKALTAFHAVQEIEPKPSGCEATKAPVERSRTRAVALAMEAKADKHYTEYRIGKMYNAGLGTEQDYTKAAEWFTLASVVDKSQHRKGNKYAQYSLGGLYYKGNGVTQNYETALLSYRKSAVQDFPYASYELAKMHRDGIGTVKNESEAGEHFKKAFTGFVALEKQSQDDKLQYRIGQMYQTGTGTEKDLVRATEYFEKSARLGNTYAQYQLAKIYLADEAASAEKIQIAIDWLTKSAEGENQFAQYALAKLYRDGTHVEKNEIEALRLFMLSAEQDNEFAQYALGKLYLHSDVIAKDATAAVKWLSKSSDLGNQFAQYALGKLYLLGEDV